MRFYKKIIFLFSLLLIFLMVPCCEAMAAGQAMTHELMEEAVSLGLSPADPITGRAVSSLLGAPLSDDDKPADLEELCVLLCSYLEEKELVLPAMRTDVPTLPRPSRIHRDEITVLYQSGLLGEELSSDKLKETIPLARGCLLLSAFLSAAEPADHFQPVSSLKEESGIELDSLQDTLFLGHSNVLGMARCTDSPITFAASNGVKVSEFLHTQLTVVNPNRQSYAENLLREKSYKKVYIMLGTNDLGRHPEALCAFDLHFRELIELVRSCQPKAELCLVGITPLKFSEPSLVQFRQGVVRTYNQTIKSLSRDMNTAYLDTYTPMAAPSGYNRRDLAKWDGVHYQAEGYERLLQLICSHPLPSEGGV